MQHFLLTLGYTDFCNNGFSGGSYSPYSMISEPYLLMVRMFKFPYDDTMQVIYHKSTQTFFAKLAIENACKN